MFDPTIPQEGTPLDAVQMRGQLNGLKALIDAAPGITGVVIDGVNTLPAGDPASVNLSLVGSTLHFSFGLPKGDIGPAGELNAGDLAAAIQGTSGNSNVVSTLGQVADGGYNQAQIQDLINKVDSLILALRR